MRFIILFTSLLILLFSWNASAQFDVDLDVTFISRTPLYPGYHRCVEYDEGGFNPRLNQEGMKITKDHPDDGEAVTFTAHVINKGRKSSKSCSYMWRIGDKEVDKGILDALKPGKEMTVSFEWKWKSERTAVEFVLDAEGESEDGFADNNMRTVYSDAWLLFMYVHRNVYDKANSIESLYGSYSFEDYVQHHIDVMNQKFADSKYPSAPDGCHARVAIDRFWIYDEPKDLGKFLNDPEGPIVKHLYDGIWGFPWKEAKEGQEQRNYADIIDNKMDWGLPHELGHQLGLIDYYNSDLYPCNNFVTGDDGYPIRIGHTASVQGMMRTHGDVLFSELSVLALNAQIGKRRGFFGDYLLVTPDENYVEILDNIGKPVPGAIVRFYQYENSAMPDRIVFAGYTDEKGLYRMPNRHAKSLTTLNGFMQQPNPFGTIQTNGRNANMFLSITARGHTEYRWFDLYMLNREWFAGNRDKAVITFMTSIATEGAVKPPIPCGDFLTPEKLILSWHKYPNMWAEAFKLFKREVNIGAFPYGVDSVDIQPFEEVLYIKQSEGIWDKEIELGEGYYEYYMTSLDDFERESNPSRRLIIPSLRFRGKPLTMTVDDESNIIYAADSLSTISNNWRIDAQRNFTSVFLSPPDRKFGSISDIIFSQNMFIATSPSQNCVFFYDRSGNGLFSLGMQGKGPGEFDKPTGLAVKGKKLYVCDTGNDRIQIFNLDGKFIKEFGTSGSGPGKFSLPSGIALAADGSMAVSDSGNNRVQLFGPGYSFITELKDLKGPRGIDCYSDKFYIADTENNRVLKTDRQLKIIQVVDKLYEQPLQRPMDVYVHHHPSEGKRRGHAILFVADYGSGLLREMSIPNNELERRPRKKPKDKISVATYGRFFDLDDPDAPLKPLQIALSGMHDPQLSTREWTIKIDSELMGAKIKEKEASFIVDQYYRAFVDFEIEFADDDTGQPVREGENYALASMGSKAEGLLRAELAIDGNLKNYDGANGYAHGVWRKPKPDALTITLAKPVFLNRINILLWDRDNRYYDYVLEVSVDGEKWEKLKDYPSPNVIRDIEAMMKKFNPKDSLDDALHIDLDYSTGYRGWVSHSTFQKHYSSQVKFIRLTSKYNSANSGFQIVELEAWGTKGQ